jgi:hypothetical protein
VQLANPKFSEKRWLDNSIHLLSSNYLQKKERLQLRVNVSYLNDYQQQRVLPIRSFCFTIDLLEEKIQSILLQFFANKFYTSKKTQQKLFQK